MEFLVPDKEQLKRPEARAKHVVASVRRQGADYVLEEFAGGSRMEERKRT